MATNKNIKNNKNLETFVFSPAQREIFEHPARFKVVAKGRRFGMTEGAVVYIIRQALAGNFSRALWVDTTNNNIVSYVRNLFIPFLKGLEKGQWEWKATLQSLRIGDAWLDMRSSDRPENLEGFAYEFAFLNEAGIILKDNYLWKNAIQPMLMDYQSPAIIAGTPKGKNTFYELAQMAEKYAIDEPDGKLWKFFRFSTHDNPFIPPEEIAVYVGSIDAISIRQEILGEFIDGGSDRFAWAFSTEKHVGETTVQAGETYYLSFDFNVSPITCIVAQHTPKSIRILREFRMLNSDIFALCTEIKKLYTGVELVVTGDATGSARSALTAGHANYYTILRQELNLQRSDIRTPRSNGSHSNSRMLLNSILQRHPDFRIDPRCSYLIKDLENVGMTTDGRIDKAADPKLGHLLDGLRYYLQTFHSDFVKQF